MNELKWLLHTYIRILFSNIRRSIWVCLWNAILQLIFFERLRSKILQLWPYNPPPPKPQRPPLPLFLYSLPFSAPILPFPLPSPLPLNGTNFQTFFYPTFFLLQLNPTYMKRILHFKNITFKSSYNWFKIDIHQQLRPLTANYLAMFKVISTTIYT